MVTMMKLLRSTTILTFVLLLVAQTWTATGQYSCSYMRNCDTDKDCVNTEGCSSCIGGMCSPPCAAEEAVCQMREDIYTCYNQTSQLCCPDSFSHGYGAICEKANNGSCCWGFSTSTCTTGDQICCQGVYAAACPAGNQCCGQSYPVCVDPSSQICCCGSIACPSSNTCNCDPEPQCVSNDHEQD
eukprot:TRINITY_DN9990_c0_g1_i1.p1 TRINITY_DN9990_c0_g1~~TRINITY_DN9990_c0_g1_i1.p1  ORF type:complete len:200 (+),score=13.97 TRINITY_DN9990_c0_g1_i1:48-602(+)